ncbi:MAG: phosphatidylinositol kinase, partial [Robiginitomaculum sp.]
RENSTRPAADSLRFLERVIFNYLIGNADAHGKNYSLLYTNTKPQLAPAYDLLCTRVYPELSIRMAMKIGKKYKPNDVFIWHWNRLVPDTKSAHKNLGNQLTKMADNCVGKSKTLHAKFESQGIKSEIFGDIIAVIKSRANHINGGF